MVLPEFFIVELERRLFCAVEITTGIEIDDDGRPVVVVCSSGFFEIHCSIVFDWTFCCIYASRNSGCSERYVRTESAVSTDVVVSELAR